jgi:hypothetical protein
MRIKLFVVLLSLAYLEAVSQKIINVLDFGLKPNTYENAIPFVNKAIEACKEDSNCVLFFPKGRYDFWPQNAIEKVYYETNTTDNNPKRLAILFERLNNITLDGDSSTFIMHDRMQPITVEKSNDVKLKNFCIDWDVPLTSQGLVVEVGPDYFDLNINSCEYPFILENFKLVFIGEGWKSKVTKMLEFDSKTGIIQMGDDALGINWQNYKAYNLGKNLVRIKKEGGFERFPKLGNYLVLRHNERDHAGIFLIESKNISLENITIHHSAGLGVLSQYSENIGFENVKIIPNEDKGRFFSGHDDGFHFMGCKGLIKVNNCEWKGLLDDPINVHGTCVRIAEVISPTKIRCEFMHFQSQGLRWAIPNDKVGLIDNNSMNTVAYNKVLSFNKISDKDFILEVKSTFSQEIKVGMALENLTWTPDVEIRNCKFLSCRARGLLISTPGKVVVENNIFESSGSAILIAGDANHWYESGAVKDVVIRNNQFNFQCLSSMYQFTEAIITILPEIPNVNPLSPYHKNIRIENNTFNPFDYPILQAKSVDGLVFNNNIIKRSYELQPFHSRKSGISLNACLNVKVQDNEIVGDVLGNNISLENMNKKELTISKKSFFKINFLPKNIKYSINQL